MGEQQSGSTSGTPQRDQAPRTLQGLEDASHDGTLLRLSPQLENLDQLLPRELLARYQLCVTVAAARRECAVRQRTFTPRWRSEVLEPLMREVGTVRPTPGELESADTVAFWLWEAIGRTVPEPPDTAAAMRRVSRFMEWSPYVDSIFFESDDHPAFRGFLDWIESAEFDMFKSSPSRWVRYHKLHMVVYSLEDFELPSGIDRRVAMFNEEAESLASEWFA